MPTDIIPKPISQTPLWQDILLYLSLILLVGVIFSCLLLGHFQKKTIKEIEAIEQSLNTQKTTEEISLEKQVFDYQKKLQDISFLLEKYNRPSNFLKFLEDSTHPEVVFTKLNLNPKRRAVLTGVAKNFMVLGQQLLILQEREEVSQANLSNISIEKSGEIGFSLNLSLNPSLFK